MSTRIRVLAPEDSIVRWKPNHAYVANEQALAPDGEIVQAKTNFTSGASYTGANWTPVLDTVYLRKRIITVATTAPTSPQTNDLWVDIT